MTKPLEKQIFPLAENTGKCYIDPESTQIFIEALVKTREEDELKKTNDTDSLETLNRTRKKDRLF